MQKKPLKRSKYLVALSKDHHAGLLFSWKIKEGLKRNIEPARIKKYIGFFWEHHLADHFKEEEALLFNRPGDALCLKAKADHRMLASYIAALNDQGEGYAVFSELLIAHIRFEERELFPHLETVLPVTVLNQVCKILSRNHLTPFIDNYPDEFWVGNKN